MKRLLVPLVLSFLLLQSCLDVETAIDLNSDGSGQVRITYTIDSELYEMGVFDESETALPVPVSRAEFERTASSIEGLRLRRYRLTENAETVTVEATLRFDSPEALDSWYGGGGAAISLTTTDGGTIWRQLIVPGGGVSGNGEPNVEALAESLETYSLHFSLRAPEAIASLSTGRVLEDGRTAEFVIAFDEILLADDAIVWEVRW